MKSFKLFFMIVLILPALAHAKKGGPETEALYVVPGDSELITHSRFIVEIVEPFVGAETQKISYIFPEVLIGEANRLIEFERIPDTENSWKSDLLTAHCMTIDDHFSCNILVNKEESEAWLDSVFSSINPKAYATPGQLCSGKAIAHVKTMEIPEVDQVKFTKVIGNFCSSEPAGILSYEFQ